MKIILTSLLCFCFLLSTSQDKNRLWFNKPADFFEETLILGNGRMGASIFGGVETDQIYLNDISLWAGEPVKAVNPDAYNNIPAIREALKNHDYKLADQLQRKIQGNYTNSYAPLGTLFLDLKHSTEATNYYRELDLSTAISKVKYEVNGVQYEREYFISHPDQVLIIKLKSSKKGSLNFDLRFTSLLKYEVTTEQNLLEVNGYAPYYAAPSYQNVKDPVRYDKDRGTKFTTLYKIKNTDGTVFHTDSLLSLRDATEAIVYISNATSFNGFDKNPAKDGKDNHKIAHTDISKAYTKTFPKIKKDHLKDYQRFYNRVDLNLGFTNAPNLPNHDRLKRYALGEEDKNLEVLYFNFGRYLMISSSRTPEIPANLQGLWNPYIRPPWSSNYTININLQENYWPVEVANLSEFHQPMLGFIENISKTGAITAKNFYGMKGWAAGHNSDVWATSNPVGEGSGGINWANWNMGGAWLSTHLWEHYTFTGDKEFLKNKAYPVMKGSAEFCLGWLIEDKNGDLITSPSTSPENKFITPTGYASSTDYGSTSDLAIIRENFDQVIKSSEILGIDEDFRNQLKKALAKLRPYQIGKKGNLQEWYHDWEDEDKEHRHQTHLFGLYPGHHITPDKTPKLAKASAKTLELRGNKTTGWSTGWRVNLWARLLDDVEAYKVYRVLLKYVDPDGYKGPNKQSGGGTYPNLMDAHAPFQIDGNFGGTAGVIEILIQSTLDEIKLLPALPKEWNEGSISGIKARGGFEVSMKWKEGKPTQITLFSKNGGITNLSFNGVVKPISLKKGKKITVNW